MHPYIRYATDTLPEILRSIGQLVECESPSGEAAEVNRCVDLLVEQTRDFATAKRIRCGAYGNALRLEFKLPGRAKGAQILGLGHSDTVWPMGTLARMPFREAKGRLWGPGVLDMKSGLQFFIAAVRLLRDLDVAVARKVALLVVPEEEVGSVASRQLTETEAGKSEAVLVLEPGTGLSGKLKTSRKGVGRYTLSVHGKAAHAGVDFEMGASAVVELAHQILQVSELTDLERGITVNAGVIRGGTRANVIAAEAQIDIDVRAVRAKDGAWLDRKMRLLRARDKRCKVAIAGGFTRPPMERTPGIKKLFARAAAIAGEMGTALEESATGGGSDGNFTAALGIPTLDGLGGVGEGAHAENESILTGRVADRVALLAGLLARL